jgi:hypothetical protein
MKSPSFLNMILSMVPITPPALAGQPSAEEYVPCPASQPVRDGLQETRGGLQPGAMDFAGNLIPGTRRRT